MIMPTLGILLYGPPGYNADNCELRTLRARCLDTSRRLASPNSNR